MSDWIYHIAVKEDINIPFDYLLFVSFHSGLFFSQFLSFVSPLPKNIIKY